MDLIIKFEVETWTCMCLNKDKKDEKHFMLLVDYLNGGIDYGEVFYCSTLS